MAKEEVNKEAVEKNEAAGIAQEKVQELADKSKENRKAGGSDVTVNLVNKTLVRFTKDFGKHIKKGDEMEVSDLALQIYTDKKSVEKI